MDSKRYVTSGLAVERAGATKQLPIEEFCERFAGEQGVKRLCAFIAERNTSLSFAYSALMVAGLDATRSAI